MHASFYVWKYRDMGAFIYVHIYIYVCTSVCVCSSVCRAHKGRDYGCLMVVPGRDDVVFCEAGFWGWRWPRLHGLCRAMGLRVAPIPSCLQFSS